MTVAIPALDNDAQVSIATGDALDVRKMTVTEGISTLFRIELEVLSPNQDIDFDAVVGRDASVAIQWLTGPRKWTGIVNDLVQTKVEPDGVATYVLSIVPNLWFSTQRKNYRVFQNVSELDVAEKLLSEYGIKFENRTQQDYKPRWFMLQYGETDFAVISRMLEAIGVSYAFVPSPNGSLMVLSDALEQQAPAVDPLPFFDEPPPDQQRWAKGLTVRRQVRPGKHRIQDLDYRRPATAQPALEVQNGLPQESALETMEWDPGAFLFETDAGGDTPNADDRGIARTDTASGERLVSNRLLAARSTARIVGFDAPIVDLVPGQTVRVTGHPHREVDGKNLLIVKATVTGSPSEKWNTHVECAATDLPYRPPMETPKPVIAGVESAVVVGPAGEEIHTDEFARVRVQFHWDREGARNEGSSCWVPVNQPWGGAGFGAINLPRIGQEVLIEFVGGDPDQPIILGRVFTQTQPPPYKLPSFKKVSGIRSETSPRAGAVASAAAAMAKNLLGGGGQPLDAFGVNKSLQHPFFNAQSPDTSTHQWSGNELSFFDQPGSQQLYMQAEKNMNTVVKNASTAVVGNQRSTQVGTDDILVVGNRQSTTIADNQATFVGGSRTVTVLGSQSHTVHGDISVTGFSNQSYAITNKWDTQATVQEHKGTEMIVLQVGASRIVMRPDFIIIQATNVFINPGDGATDAAISEGTRPQTAEEQREAERKAAAEAEAAAAHERGLQALRDYTAGPLPPIQQVDLLGRPVENTFARQALRDAGVTDRAAQDAVFEDYFRETSPHLDDR